MKTRNLLITGAALAALAFVPAGAQQGTKPAAPLKLQQAPLPPMPKTGPTKRINRIIELWQSGQPVYYTSTDEGGFELGKKMAGTKADYINYGMESGPLDFTRLREFMQGLVEGRTRSGHRFVPVIVTLPVPGTVEAMKGSAWLFQQALATGISGILLCNAESPEAVRLLMQAARYPFAPAIKGIQQGTRGNGSQGFPAEIWGISASEYMRVADIWPANPEGELLIGVKIENPRADMNVDEILAIPGVSFVEHGPGDNGFYFLGRPGSPGRLNADNNPAMIAIRERVFAAAKRNNVKFLHGCSEATVEAMIKEGVMICTGGDTPAADKGRAFSKRQMPV